MEYEHGPLELLTLIGFYDMILDMIRKVSFRQGASSGGLCRQRSLALGMIYLQAPLR
jgi:hypothetical protein